MTTSLLQTKLDAYVETPEVMAMQIELVKAKAMQDQALAMERQASATEALAEATDRNAAAMEEFRRTFYQKRFCKD